MSQFEEVFVDMGAYQPPSKWQARLSHLLVLLIAGLLLIGGWMLREWMLDQFRYLALGEGQVAIPYPPTWQVVPTPGLALRAVDPHSTSVFPPQEMVRLFPRESDSLEAFWQAQRTHPGPDYREISRYAMQLGQGPALVVEYAYAAKVEDASTPLVAVRAVDVVFPVRYGGEERWAVVTLAADAQDWSQVWPTFQRILSRMGLRSMGISGE